MGVHLFFLPLLWQAKGKGRCEGRGAGRSAVAACFTSSGLALPGRLAAPLGCRGRGSDSCCYVPPETYGLFSFWSRSRLHTLMHTLSDRWVQWLNKVQCTILLSAFSFKTGTWYGFEIERNIKFKYTIWVLSVVVWRFDFILWLGDNLIIMFFDTFAFRFEFVLSLLNKLLIVFKQLLYCLKPVQLLHSIA